MCIKLLVTISQNEPLCCEGCSLLIISGSLLAMLTGGQRSPWCEVVSLLKFAFISSSIGSIGTKLHMWSTRLLHQWKLQSCALRTLKHTFYFHIKASVSVVSLFSFTAVLCVQRLIGVVSTGSPTIVVIVTACLASWVTGVVFGSVPVVYAWIKYTVYSVFAVNHSLCCFVFVHLHHVFFLPQVRPCRDAVCCLLGEQLFRHVGLHTLCVLYLHIPPLPAYLLLLSIECVQLLLKLHQVNHLRNHL